MRKHCLLFLVVFFLLLLLTGCFESAENGAGVLPEPQDEDVAEDEPLLPAEEPPDSGELMVAYSVMRDLMLAIGYNPPRLLTEGYGDYEPLIAPDGGKILFKRPVGADEDDLFPFELWVIDIDGSNPYPLVLVDDLPGEEGELFDSPDPVIFDRLPMQVSWLNDSSAIIFNTQLNIDYGVKVYNDLWQVSVEEPQVMQVLADNRGGSFALSPDGEVLLLGGMDYVSIYDLNTKEYRELFQFPAINTASEFPFIPMPSWAPDSSYGLVAIPDPEPYDFGENLPELAIWLLSRNGDVQITTLVEGYNLWDAMSGELLSPDGLHFAYATGYFPDGEVRIATLDGQTVNTFNYAYDFMGWSTDGSYIILYADSPYLGGLHVEERELDTHNEVFAWSAFYKWVDHSTYVAIDFSYFQDEPILWVTTIGGESRIIDYGAYSFDARFQ